jgi:hypothetical protein
MRLKERDRSREIRKIHLLHINLALDDTTRKAGGHKAYNDEAIGSAFPGSKTHLLHRNR